MNKSLIYRNTTFFLAILVIIGLFIEPKRPIIKDIYELLFAIIFLLMFAFAFLWKRRRILFFGFILALVGFNFDILFNPILQIENQSQFIRQSNWIGLIFSSFAFICLLLGLSNKLKVEFLIKEVSFGVLIIITIMVVTIGIFQLSLRL